MTTLLNAIETLKLYIDYSSDNILKIFTKSYLKSLRGDIESVIRQLQSSETSFSATMIKFFQSFISSNALNSLTIFTLISSFAITESKFVFSPNSSLSMSIELEVIFLQTSESSQSATSRSYISVFYSIMKVKEFKSELGLKNK